MTGGDPALPRGYVTVQARYGSGVFQETFAPALAAILERQSLYDCARAARDASAYQGRLPAYGASVPGLDMRVVVRHATHGGMLARLTRDRFVGDGRAAHEIRVSHALRERGVPTPRMIGFASYRAGPLFVRLDVVTEEVPDGRDLATTVASGSNAIRPMLEATARLLAALARAGAHHADLNLKNVLLTGEESSPRAIALDVDRVSLGVAQVDAMRRNLARFVRSARKWRSRRGPSLSESDLHWLASRARELAS